MPWRRRAKGGVVGKATFVCSNTSLRACLDVRIVTTESTGACRAITFSVVAGPVWSMMLFIFEWATRAPMIVDLSVPLHAQHAIITGACGGMGEELAILMVSAGARVVLGCRDGVKADAALSRIQAATAGLSGSVEQIHLDLASLKSVRSFASEYTRSYTQLNLLVNNGGSTNACNTTEDGNDYAFQVNYLSHFLLTNLMLPLLKNTPASRIVHVTCHAAETAGALPERGIWGWLYDSVVGSAPPVAPEPLDVSNLDGRGQDGQARCSPSHQYAMSKLAQIVFSKQLDERLAANYDIVSEVSFLLLQSSGI